MQPDESLGAFRERLTTLGQGATRLTPAAGIAAMIAFFREVYAAYLAAFRANDIQAIDELVQYPLAYIGPALTRTPSGWRFFAVSDITVPT